MGGGGSPILLLMEKYTPLLREGSCGWFPLLEALLQPGFSFQSLPSFGRYCVGQCVKNSTLRGSIHVSTRGREGGASLENAAL